MVAPYGRGLPMVHGGGNGNHPYLMSFSYFPGGVLKMAVWHASPCSLSPLSWIYFDYFFLLPTPVTSPSSYIQIEYGGIHFDRPLCVHVNPIVNSINGFFRYFFGKNFSARLLLLFQNSDYKKNTKFEYYYDQRF